LSTLGEQTSVRIYIIRVKIFHGSLRSSKHLFFRNEIKHHEEDRTAEKVLDLPARSPALRDEGRAEPLMDLTRTLKNPS
jgi:hypothetical protein